MTTKMDQAEAPLYIKVHESDNVAIIVNTKGLSEGTVFPSGLELVEFVPQGHKVALVDLQEHEAIIRYGEVIGHAVKPIPKGSWIKESLLTFPTPPPLDTLPLATRDRSSQKPLEGYTFEGFKNSDGSVGTKNILGITMSVQCVTGVLEHAVKRVKEELLPNYPNVEDVIALNHNYGCGVAIHAPGAAIPIRTIQNLATHPSFGGEIMVVGLGCEKLRPEQLVKDDDGSTITSLQDQEGFHAMVSSIMAMAEERLLRLNQRKRVTCPAADLVVGMQCGGSDAFSGVTANPAVGFAADLLVRAGATVFFSEVTEVRDAVHLLTPRVVNEEVGKKLVEEMRWYDDYLASGDADRSANPSPGNKKGGLSNVVEKALGSIVKSGTSPIVDVLSPGEKATKKGLIFAATPASDFVCGTLQLASGMNMHVFTTGRGTPYGLSMAPVIKVSTRTALKEQWHDLIDVNAGQIATGEATIEDVGWELFHLMLDVASGKKQTWAQKWKLHNDLSLFNPGPVT
ncbi:galactarate dehydratase [Aureibacillus halotolerans]|nr:galactarate dehydratase [Aureibacillus halotolerans]